MSQILIRIYKKLNFYEKELAQKNKNMIEKKFKLCERSIIFVYNILKNNIFKKLIEKDLATILLDNLEFYRNEYEKSPDENKKRYPLEQLVYYIFYFIKSPNLIREMINYATDKSRDSVYINYLVHFRDNNKQFNSLIKKVKEDEDILLLKNFDINKHRIKYEKNFKELFKWQYIHKQISQNKSYYFFKNYTEKEIYFKEIQYYAKSEAEIIYNKYSSSILAITALINELNISYNSKLKKYEIDLNDIDYNLFLNLSEKLQNLLKELSNLEFIINNHFPFYEKNLLLGNQNSAYGINALQKFIIEKRNELIDINKALINEDENFLIKAQFNADEKKCRVLKKYKYFLQKWLYNRFNFSFLLKKTIKNKKNNQKKNNILAIPTLFSSRLILKSIRIFALTILAVVLPFLAFSLGKKLDYDFLISFASATYSSYFYLIISIFFYKSLRILFKNKKHSNERMLSTTDLLLPKMLALILISYFSFAMSDEIWVIFTKINIFLDIAIIFVISSIIYWILKITIFDNYNYYNLTENKKNEIKKNRIFSLMSIGLIESFIINLLGGIGLSEIMKHNTRANFEAIIPNESEFSLKIDIILDEVYIYPKLIFLWTFLIFGIGVILQLFVQKDEIIHE